MRAMPEGLDVAAVIEALREGWGFDVHEAAYAPVGAGSYHWEVTGTTGGRGFATVDDLDQKAWLGDERDPAFDGLRRAFDTAVALRDGGLEFVLAPIRTRDGESLRRLDSRYTLALFPFVEGETAEFGYYDDDEESRNAVVAMLAELHRAAVPARPVGFELPGRGHIEAALRELNDAWTGGPLSEPAREAIRESASELAQLLTLADRLRAEAETRGGEWVVTHGEPHAANVMRTSERRFLVDWDTVALAPPERDLWMVLDGSRDSAALDYFRLTWDLKDIAEYLKALRAPHEENDDTLRWYGALRNCAAIREEWAARL